MADSSCTYYDHLEQVLKAKDTFDGELFKCTRKCFFALKKKTLQVSPTIYLYLFI